MAGYADIDDTSPAGSVAADQIDEVIRALKEDIVEGAGVEHDDGQTTAAHQGLHAFPIGGTLPDHNDRPTGHLFFLSGSADQLLGRVDNGSGWSKVGIGSSQILDSSAVVNNGTESAINIQAWSAAHVDYVISAYTNGASSPIVHIGYDDPGGSDIYVWVERDKAAGQDELHIANRTATNETVFYRVSRLVI